MKNLLAIQARSNSTRLPKKIYMEILGRPILERVYVACVQANAGDVTVIGPPNDKELEEFCAKRSFHCSFPEVDENDLIARYMKASEGYEGVVRITADCPLVEPKIIANAAKLLESNDYVSNTVFRTMPDGVDVQACRRTFLEWINETQKENREHPFFDFDNNISVRNASPWKIGTIIDPSNAACLKISVDTEKDLEFVRRLIEARESKLVRPD